MQELNGVMDREPNSRYNPREFSPCPRQSPLEVAFSSGGKKKCARFVPLSAWFMAQVLGTCSWTSPGESTSSPATKKVLSFRVGGKTSGRSRAGTASWRRRKEYVSMLSESKWRTCNNHPILYQLLQVFGCRKSILGCFLFASYR